VAVYRRRKQDFFLLAWGLSSLIMAQPWVVQDYQWRFTLMLATPIVPLAAVGLVEGVGAVLWKAGDGLRGLHGKTRSKAGNKNITWVGRGALICLVIIVAANQALVSNRYAWTNQQIQPQISMGEYNAMENFRNKFGEVSAFGGDMNFLYWIDAVGLKGTIQVGEVTKSLSQTLMESSRQGSALTLAVEWYDAQQQAGENIYALASTGSSEIQPLENGQLFKLVFSHPSMRGYALNENFVPPENYSPSGPTGPQTFSFAAEFQPPQPPQPHPPDNHPQQPSQNQPPQQQPQQSSNESLALKVLLAPVYVLPSGARFVVGVPLTVLLWVFLPCLVWAGLKRMVSGKGLETLGLAIVIAGIILLVLVVAVFV